MARCILLVLFINLFTLLSSVYTGELPRYSNSTIDCSKRECLSSETNGNPQGCVTTNSIILNPTIFYHCSIIPFVKRLAKFEEANMIFKSWELDMLQYVYIAIFLLVIFVLLLFFFLILFLCANDHLVPTLSFISDKLSLSPSVAGVTLLALGNAAPDLFTSLAGVENMESIPLVISGAIGSGLFITVFVFGIILTKTKPSPPEIRQPVMFGTNILMYFCAICMVSLIVFPKEITLIVPMLGFILYSAYIFFVLWVEKSSSSSGAPVPPSIYRNSMSLQSIRSLTSKPHSIDKAGMFLGSVDSQKSILASESSLASHAIDIQETNAEQAKEFEKSYSSKLIRNPFKIFVYLFAFLLSISIPPIIRPSELDNNQQLKRSQKIRIIFSPFFSLCLILTCLRLWNTKTLLLYVVASVLMSAIAYLSVQNIYVDTIKFAVISSTLAGLSFAMATFWSWAVSREVISLFTAIPAIIPGFPQSILGLTVMAWGNSFGDLVVGLALSSTENFELGITGVFSGPVLNVLLSLSISIFKMLLTNKFQMLLRPQFDTTIYISLALLALTTIISLFFYKSLASFGRIYGKFLIFTYLGLFLPFLVLNSVFFS
ncbi:Mitochondrial sodium/calcium exchanger protein [Mitosporidium daphniae]